MNMKIQQQRINHFALFNLTPFT